MMISTAQTPRPWFVILRKGDLSSPDEATAEANQKSHLDNFRRLFAERLLLAAGPLRDPTGMSRGIAVLNVASREDMDVCFGPDPFIQAGIMTLDASPWLADLHRLNSTDPDPEQIEENRIGILTGSKEVPSYLQSQHREWVANNLSPTLFGRLDCRGYREVHLFSGPGDGPATEYPNSPLVQLGWARYEFMPLWLAKGALRAE